MKQMTFTTSLPERRKNVKWFSRNKEKSLQLISWDICQQYTSRVLAFISNEHKHSTQWRKHKNIERLEDTRSNLDLLLSYGIFFGGIEKSGVEKKLKSELMGQVMTEEFNLKDSHRICWSWLSGQRNRSRESTAIIAYVYKQVIQKWKTFGW